MPRKKPIKDPQAELDATCKLLCDEARNHMKVRNFLKALSVYNKVNINSNFKTNYIKPGYGILIITIKLKNSVNSHTFPT